MTEFIESLKARLAGGLPGEDAQRVMAPPARPRFAELLASEVMPRQSAVLLYLFPHQADWRMVLMKRTDYEGPHGGQVSIPGGRLEPGEDHRQAALREFAEETGVAVDRGQLLGALSDLFIPTSSFLVRPYLAYTTGRPNFDPDPLEVEQLIELTLTALASDDIVKSGLMQPCRGPSLEAPYFDVDGHAVWGATAMILSELKEILRGLR